MYEHRLIEYLKDKRKHTHVLHVCTHMYFEYVYPYICLYLYTRYTNKEGIANISIFSHTQHNRINLIGMYFWHTINELVCKSDTIKNIVFFIM